MQVVVFKRVSLPQVTMVCVAGVEPFKAARALLISTFRVKFYNSIIVTPHIKKLIWLRIFGVKVIKPYQSNLDSMREYNRYIVFELHRHVSTSHCLVIQADGFVLNPSSWSPEFLQYDYIGAPWPVSDNSYISPYGENIRVGNGGFSLRSSKLLTVPIRRKVEFEVNKSDSYKHFNHNSSSEDGVICVHNRHIYLEDGCNFAPVSLAAQFSRELYIEGVTKEVTFGFHKYKSYKSK